MFVYPSTFICTLTTYSSPPLPPKKIPKKEREKATTTERVFCARIKVAEKAPFLGHTYGEAGLEVPGSMIVQIEAEGKRI